MSHPIPPSPAGQPLGATVAAPAAPAASTPVSWPDAARRAAFDAWLAPLVGPHQLLPATLRPTHISLFDGTLQGLERTDKPAFCFQGHPEASPGPHDIAYLFDRFTALMEKK